MSEKLVKRLRDEAASNEAGVRFYDGEPDIDQANDTMQCAADELRAAAAEIERLTAERDAAEARAEKLAEALKGEAIVALEAVAMDAVATGRGENTISDDVCGQVDAALVFCYAALQGEKQDG